MEATDDSDFCAYEDEDLGMNETYTTDRLMSSSKVKPLLVTPEEINEIV
jgi:hypothetical protein